MTMAETTGRRASQRKSVVGEVTSTKMQKTIVVEVIRRKAGKAVGSAGAA